MIREYQAYNSGIFIQGKDHPVYTPAVATVVAWFHAKGYKLAAELLTQAKKNNKINSIYYPKYGDRVKNLKYLKKLRKIIKLKVRPHFRIKETRMTKIYIMQFIILIMLNIQK